MIKLSEHEYLTLSLFENKDEIDNFAFLVKQILR